MEPLAALGLAGNILQFIQFTSELVFKGSEVYSSVSGAAATTIELEKVYERLWTFSSNLHSSGTTDVGSPLSARGFRQSPEAGAHIASLKDLARDCKALCNQLLQITQNLHVKDGRWQRVRSFITALRTVWDSNKIADLEKRLDRYQRLLLLHIFPVLRYFTTVGC